MSRRRVGIGRILAEQARRPAFTRYLGNASAAAVYFGPATAGHRRSVRLMRAFVLRRRMRLAFRSVETGRRRRELIRGALAVGALGGLAVVLGPPRRGRRSRTEAGSGGRPPDRARDG
jgi:hypothetical protein